MFSFNNSRYSVAWEGFSLRWYARLFSSPEILDALKVSLIVAISSTILSVLIATCFVIAGRWWRAKVGGHSWLSYALFYPNVVLPDIALAIGILSIFAFLKVPLGYGSLIAGHTLIGLGFVVPIVKTRFVELDPLLTEASLDLGATRFQTFGRVLIPLLSPSLFASALIVFTLSLDDFLIAFFCSSPKVQTLSIYVYSQMRETVDPSINAISVILLAFSSVVVLVLCSMKLVDRVIHNE
jgi:spermidine/putrescine transport system permease protein